MIRDSTTGPEHGRLNLHIKELDLILGGTGEPLNVLEQKSEVGVKRAETGQASR